MKCGPEDMHSRLHAVPKFGVCKFLVTGAADLSLLKGHRVLFNLHGRRSTLSTLPKGWHAWMEARDGFQDHFSWCSSG